MILKFNLKNKIILLTFILLIIIFSYFINNKENNLDLINVVEDFEQSSSYYYDYYYEKFDNGYKEELNLDIKNNIIENWDLYEPILITDEKWVGTGDCGSSEFNNFLLKTRQGGMSMLKLQGTLDLVITPNYYSWNNDYFLNLLYQSDVICAVAGRYPLHAYEDKLLWIGVCYEEELDCQGAQYLVEQFKEKY